MHGSSAPVKLLRLFALICGGIQITSSAALAGLYAEAVSQRPLLHDGKMHVFLIGTGAPEAEMENIRRPACVAVVVDGQFLLIDAGEGAIQTIAGLGLPYESISTIFMTHWHSDHFGGLGQVINASWIHGRKNKLDIYGPYGTNQVVGALSRAYELDTIFRSSTVHGFLDPNIATGIAHEIDPPEAGSEVYSRGDIHISAFPVEHSPVVPAFGYVIKYHGAKVVISGDTCIVKSLEEQSQDADLLISEAFSHPLSRLEMNGAVATQIIVDLSKYHADSLELAKMAQRAHVKHLVLTHLVPSIPTTDEAKRAFTAGMSDLYKGDLVVSDDGDQVAVKSTGAGVCEVEYLPHKQPVIPVVPRSKDESPTG